ncbi:MAG: DnaJ domain-containing protein [Termitinemataceae bacterium]|nr:MAG: DnaJ domain-containing protein [Termitinemataceae bacterium]
MVDHYSTLGIGECATPREIRKAFREKAKQLHPDIAGMDCGDDIQKIITAYEVLSDKQRRADYDRLYRKPKSKDCFSYRDYLNEQQANPEALANLVVFDLLHFEEDKAIDLWRKLGGNKFPLKKYILREDWMDCTYILAEQLYKRGAYYETFLILADLVAEENREPYFKHFAEDVKVFIKELVRIKLKNSVDNETWISCLDIMLNLDFGPSEEARYLKSKAVAFRVAGKMDLAEKNMNRALSLDPSICVSKNEDIAV